MIYHPYLSDFLPFFGRIFPKPVLILGQRACNFRQLFSFFYSPCSYSIEKPIQIPMIPNIRNNQDHLAEEFRQLENYLVQESRIALLKIQSWQFAMKTPEVGLHYQQEAAAMVKQSLLSFVPNSYVLSEEGYYYRPLEN
jgi:hypothetical protein